MDYICYPLGYLMKWCHDFVGNYGLAIILFTLATKIVMLPLSVWVHKNSIKIVKIQPEVNFLKAKYYGDMERIADEEAKLHKREASQTREVQSAYIDNPARRADIPAPRRGVHHKSAADAYISPHGRNVPRSRRRDRRRFQRRAAVRRARRA